MRSEVVTIDPERLFADTAYGQRVQQVIEDRSTALAAENRRIEAELVAEERALTDQRPTLPVEEFRALADAFDEKVQRLRAEQDAKTREVQGLQDREQQRFLNRVAPILSELVQERGALVVMDRRAVEGPRGTDRRHEGGLVENPIRKLVGKPLEKGKLVAFRQTIEFIAHEEKKHKTNSIL